MTLRKHYLAIIALVTLLTAGQVFGVSGTCVAAPEQGQSQGSSPQLASEEGGTAATDRLNGLPRMNWLTGDNQNTDLRTRPFLYWRAWANRPLPFVPALLFCLLTSAVAWLLLPGTLADGKECCKTSFWKSLLTGAVTLVLSAVFARFLFRSEIGFPLAALVVALLELGLILGFAVSAALVGESVLAKVGLSSRPWFAEKPTAKRLLEVIAGAALICLLLLIPGVGGLPRIGTRLVMLLAFLGFGGLMRASLARWK